MPRDRDLKIRLSEREYQKLKAESERKGVSMATILRECLQFLQEPKT